jgi:tellurite resistance protein
VWLHALTEEQRRVLLGLAHNVVVSDGLLDPNEEFMLDAFKREMDLSPRTPSDYVELDGIERIFSTRRARTIALINLLHLSYVDGAFEIEEECLLKEVSRAFGVSDREFERLDNWVRRLIALEQEARSLM